MSFRKISPTSGVITLLTTGGPIVRCIKCPVFLGGALLENLSNYGLHFEGSCIKWQP